VAELDGKVALVTGGSLGIGRATARRLVDEGAAVVLCGHDDASVAFLAGDRASFVTGAEVKVDGGLLAQIAVVIPK
jgi:NAD(P)-dependent dehydrogenase (short-subunit alcohol dehydrogenase family)